MSAIEPKFEDLLSRFLDGGLSEKELAGFLSDGRCAERFLEMTKLNSEIAGLSAAPVPDEAMIQLVMRDLQHQPDPTATFIVPTAAGEGAGADAKRPEVSRSRLRAYVLGGLALAGCICLLAVILTHIPGQLKQGGASGVASISGKVLFTGAAGQVSLTSEQALDGDGKIETVGPDSRVTLHLADGTRFNLEGDTTIEIQLNRAKPRIFLSQGCFHAEVAKQGEGRALLFDTPNAEATVHGTKFTLLWHQLTTYLMVTEGAVGIKRSPGGPELVVNAGNYCHIEPGGVYHTWPESYLPKWFNSGPPQNR